MIYIKSIDNVAGLFLSNNAFLVSNKKEIREYNFEGNLLWVKELSGNLRKCSIHKEIAYIAFADKETGFEKTAVVHLMDGKFLDSKISDFVITSVSDDGRALAFKYNPDYSRSTYCIQLPNEKIIWENELENLPLFMKGNNLISGIKKSISFIDGEGLERWKYDTSDLGVWNDYDGKEKDSEVSRILGIHENHVYLYLNSGKVLILNVETGVRLSVLENDKNIDQGSFEGMFMNAIELDGNNGKLIQLFNQRYTEVDIYTNEVTQTHLEDMKSLNLENMSRIVYDDDHIFFTDKNYHKLGAMNRSTLKIDWTYELSQEDITKSDQPRYGRELKLRDNNLLVLDNKNTLHIFEKEAESV